MLIRKFFRVQSNQIVIFYFQVNHILRLGGTEVKDVVTSIMDAVYHPSVASLYNYKGKKGKLSLSTTKSLKVIEGKMRSISLLKTVA